MRIAIVADFSYVEGGAAKVALSSAAGLARAGHDVTFLAGAGPESTTDGVVITSLDLKHIADDPNRLRAAVNGIWNTKAAQGVERFLAQCEPDTIFHVHTWTKTLSPAALSRLRSHADRVVLTLHDYFTACPNGGFFNYQTEEACQLEPMSLRCLASNCDSRSYGQKLWRVTRQGVQRTVSKFPAWCQHFIALSDTSLGRLKPYLPPGANIHRVPNPAPAVHPMPVRPSENGHFVALGRIAPEKGSIMLARAASVAAVALTFIGDGPDADGVRRENPEAVITGWLDEASVHDELRQARALVFPSLWLETYGLGILEAASHGVASLVADTSAAKELVRADGTGLHFSGGRLDALSEVLARTNAAPDLLDRFGRAAYDELAAADLTIEDHVSALEDVYRTMLVDV